MDQKSRPTSILKVTIKLTNPANTKNICIGITFVQRQLNVFDVGPTLYKSVFLICRHVVRIDDKLPPLTKKHSILTTMIYIKKKNNEK